MPFRLVNSGLLSCKPKHHQGVKIGTGDYGIVVSVGWQHMGDAASFHASQCYVMTPYMAYVEVANHGNTDTKWYIWCVVFTETATDGVEVTTEVEDAPFAKPRY